MLASDDNNPAFMGAQNPDARLAVRFYIKPVQNLFRTAQEGRAIFEDRDYVRIEVPGDRTSIIDTYATDEHKERFPIQWARYMNNKAAAQQETGTPLSEWQLITASQAEELKAVKFRTVESIASASDLQLQSIGMIGGMAPTAMRLKAQAFLNSASDSALPQKLAGELAQRDQQIADMQAQIAKMNELLMTPPPPEEAPVKKRRGAPKGGWPKKPKQEATA